MIENTPPSVPSSPNPATPRRGLSPLAWVGIGCGGLLVLGIILFVVVLAVFGGKLKEFSEEAERNPAKASAEMAVKFHPDLELVSSDEETGRITFRDKRSGEETTLSYQDVMEGRFSVESGGQTMDFSTTPDGQSSMTIRSDDGQTEYSTSAPIPQWVQPFVFPGSEAPSSTFRKVENGVATGSLTVHSSAGVSEVSTYLEGKLAEQNFEVERNAMEMDNVNVVTLTGKRQESGQEINASLVPDGNATITTIVYTGGE